jgi:hypothetical protein
MPLGTADKENSGIFELLRHSFSHTLKPHNYANSKY